MSYRPNPGTECCPGNVNRFMPNYILNSWKRDNNDIYLKLFSSSIYEADGIRIEEITNYPFDNKIELDIQTDKPFTLHIRLHNENKGFQLLINGINAEYKKRNGFLVININNNCKIEYKQLFEIKKHLMNNYVYFTRGPIVFTKAIDYKKEIDIKEEKQSDDFHAYNMYSNEKWNYGIYDDTVELDNNDGSISVEGFEIENWKYELKDRIRRCTNLYTKEFSYFKGKFVFTPKIPKDMIIGQKKLIKLIPYGLSELRVTAFPRIKSK